MIYILALLILCLAAFIMAGIALYKSTRPHRVAADGHDGAAGPRGQRGEDGAEGHAGERGATGAAGAPGKTGKGR